MNQENYELSYDLCFQMMNQLGEANTRDQLIQIINELCLNNNQSEFDIDIAEQLFDRIENFKMIPLSVSAFAQCIVEAENTLQLKLNQISDRNEEIKDRMNLLQSMDEAFSRKSFNQNLSEWSAGKNLLIIEDIAFQLNDPNILDTGRNNIMQSNLYEPYLVIKMGQFIFESDLGEVQKNNWYEWKINTNIPVDSFMDDFTIQVIDRQRTSQGGIISDYGQLMIPVELLPYEEFHSAEFKIEKENQLTSNTLMLSCQLVLGNQTGAKYQISYKQKEYSQQFNENYNEIDQISWQIFNLRKPFLAQEVQQKKFNEQNIQELDEPRKISHQQQFSNPDVFSQNTNQLHHQSLENARPSFQKGGWKPKDRTSDKNETKEAGWKEYANRTDLIATFIMIISFISSFIKPDFVHLTLAFLIVGSVIMKKVKYKFVLIAISSYIVLSLVIDILWLSLHFSVKPKFHYEVQSINQFAVSISYFAIFSNILLNIVALISSLMLFQPYPMSQLKKRLLKF